ncbi:hypothetical protein [Marinicella sp. W31]|uniref:hypothetical protein n=1 Tax=Marinicella sp. W31 TaxID=3023713 RepID=UPI003756CAD7
MSLQEYIYISISIIYGLAITRLLTKFFDAMRLTDKTDFNWSIFIWSIGVAIMLVWFIWIGFRIQSMTDLNYGVFIYLLITTITLYGAVEFSFPKMQETNPSVYGDIYRELRLSALFLVAYLLIVGLANTTFANAGWMETLKLTGIGILLTMIVILKPRFIHWVAPVFLMYALIVHTPLQKFIGLIP